LDAVLADAPLPDGFVLTLPKVTSAGQVAAMNLVCAWLESHHGLPAGRLGFEVQVETAQAIMAPDGAAEVARIVHAGEGRVTGLHYGTYDYGAALGVSAAEQRMDHPVADYATSVMQVAAAQTGVRISHGSTNVLPVGERDAALAAWALHARLVRRHLTRGIYQGWDLHPHQLVTRYAATFAFFRSGLDEVFDRLSAYLDSTEAAAEATDDAPAVLDEPASAVALGGFLLRGLQCGAVAADEVLAGTGLAADGLEALARRQRPQRAGRPTPGDTP
ncbi:MAG: aldolase, partial [Nocardioides sp.]